MGLKTASLRYKGRNMARSQHGSGMRRTIKKNTNKKRRIELKEVDDTPTRQTQYYAW